MYPSEPLGGDIAQVIVYKSVLTPDMRQIVEAILMDKWGVATSSDEANTAAAQKDVSLEVSPNPFNPSVTIRISGLTPGGQVIVFDMTGRRIADLTQAFHQGRAVWNAKNMPSGLYVVKAWLGRKVFTKKITLLK
jgi:hypothetical protein